MARASGLKTTGPVLLLLCLLWMDACLYLRIQSLDDDEREHDHSDTRTPSTANKNESLHKFTRIALMDKFSQIAFQGMSVKLMMTDPVDNYLMGPLSEAFADMVDFKHNLSFVSPNMVSYAGVVAALIAAKLVACDSPTLHKLSFVMFQLRTWLDDLDGVVARARMGIHKHQSLTKTPGYVIDGVCDAIGFVAYIIGCYIYMKRTLVRQRRLKRRQLQQHLLSTQHDGERYNLQSITELKPSDGAGEHGTAYMPLERGAHPGDGCDNQNETDSENSTNEDDDTATDDSDEGQVLHDTTEVLICKNQANTETEQQSATQRKRNLVERGHALVKVPKRLWSRYKSPRVLFNRISMRSTRGKYATHLISYRYIKEKIKHNLSGRRTVLLILCFLLQLAMCSSFWNRYILIYKDLLESPSLSAEQSRAKRKILKSNIMYIVIWFWRLTNGHSFMQMLIGSVFLGKLWEFLNLVKFVGFVEIILLATFTELHVMDVRNFLAID